LAFCSNCGLKLSEGVKFCSSCGTQINSISVNTDVSKSEETNNMQSSNNDISSMTYLDKNQALTKDENCLNTSIEKSTKKWLTALLLCIFIGGGHRFYVGKIGSGILMFILWAIGYLWGSASLQTSVYFGPAILVIPGIFFISYSIWWVIDIIMICNAKFKDKKGFLLKKDQ